jgi:hypothetical protein
MATSRSNVHRAALASAVFLSLFSSEAARAQRSYKHTLTPLYNPDPILADYPKFVDVVDEVRRFQAPPLIEDENADLEVRGWRFTYNARGIIEAANRLDGSKTAVIVVHPWGIDDGQGWNTPEPAGVAFGCTPEKNALMLEHAKVVMNPFLDAMRGKVAFVGYSLPGKEDSIRKKIYRSVRSTPTDEERKQGQEELRAKLSSFDYRAGGLPEEIELSSESPVFDYFEALPGLSAYKHYNPPGFWDLPIPVMNTIVVDPADVVFYDAEGYDVLRDYLKGQGVRHVLLCGYHADMCVFSTTAGYENLRKDFNVFLVGDCVQASLPANKLAAHSTNVAVSNASLKILITQASWVRPIASQTAASQ